MAFWFLERTCKLCKQPFTLDFCHGRPRPYCYRCEPQGWKIVLCLRGMSGVAASANGEEPRLGAREMARLALVEEGEGRIQHSPIRE